MNSLFKDSRVSGPDLFEAAWISYPARHVCENKRDALKQWLRRLKEGVPASEMLEGSRRYGAYCERLRIAGTEFVMQPRRFFGPSRHFELPWQINGGRIAAQAAKSHNTMVKLRDNEARALPPEEAKAKIRGLIAGLSKRMPN